MCKIYGLVLIFILEGQPQHRRIIFDIYTNVNIDETEKSFGSDSTHPIFLSLSLFFNKEYIGNNHFYDGGVHDDLESDLKRKLKIEAGRGWGGEGGTRTRPFCRLPLPIDTLLLLLQF